METTKVTIDGKEVAVFIPANAAELGKLLDEACSKKSRRSVTYRMQCNECGKKFNARGVNGRCPKCRGCDFEPC